MIHYVDFTNNKRQLSTVFRLTQKIFRKTNKKCHGEFNFNFRPVRIYLYIFEHHPVSNLLKFYSCQLSIVSFTLSIFNLSRFFISYGACAFPFIHRTNPSIFIHFFLLSQNERWTFRIVFDWDFEWSLSVYFEMKRNGIY